MRARTDTRVRAARAGLPSFALPERTATRLLNELLHSLVLSKPVPCGGLLVVPVLRPARPADAVEVLTLKEGIARGETRVTEVCEAGQVQRVLVRHEGELPVFLLDGEQLLGAKQNRVINGSHLLSEGMRAEVPVSCVERKRWQSNSEEFTASDATVTMTLRARKLRNTLTHSTIVGGTFDADQNAVWASVDEHLERTQVHSATRSLQDSQQAVAPQVERALRDLAPSPLQVGHALVRKGELLALDIFASAGLYARSARQLLRGALSEAVHEADEERGATRVVDSPQAARESEARALRLVAEALEELPLLPRVELSPPGLGRCLHAASPRFAFQALAVCGLVLHLSATGME